MTDTAWISVDYEMVTFDGRMMASDDRKEAKIELLIPRRLAVLLVLDRHCADNAAASASLSQIVSGMSRLYGYSAGMILNIRYANHQEA
jgi:hypothetical protein